MNGHGSGCHPYDKPTEVNLRVANLVPAKWISEARWIADLRCIKNPC